MPRYSAKRPVIVDPAGVDASLQPRPMPVTTDESRAVTAAETSGQPMTSFAGTSNPYIDYQSIDLLLSLQHPRSEGYDEMCFFVMGQVKELLFRGLHHEIVNVQAQLDLDEIANALEILDRAIVFVDYIADSWNVLSTITTEGFNEFRDTLGTASGQLSFMYRHVEFALGNKDRRLASAHENVPHVWPALKHALESPSMHDSAIALLARRGLPIDRRALDRDWSETYEPNESVEAAWRKVYEDPGTHNDLYRLGEQLMKLDQQFSIYRWRTSSRSSASLAISPAPVAHRESPGSKPSLATVSSLNSGLSAPRRIVDSPGESTIQFETHNCTAPLLPGLWAIRT